ncbi:hypothetical protein [Streptomyces sp. NPDC097640]|uniref:hypothetical protein n=1 Tax=Streptomyces sp. NPDC097640 TaxID=3157229 RepID=UPI0033285BC2
MTLAAGSAACGSIEIDYAEIAALQPELNPRHIRLHLGQGLQAELRGIIYGLSIGNTPAEIFSIAFEDDFAAKLMNELGLSLPPLGQGGQFEVSESVTNMSEAKKGDYVVTDARRAVSSEAHPCWASPGPDNLEPGLIKFDSGRRAQRPGRQARLQIASRGGRGGLGEPEAADSAVETARRVVLEQRSAKDLRDGVTEARQSQERERRPQVRAEAEAGDRHARNATAPISAGPVWCTGGPARGRARRASRRPRRRHRISSGPTTTWLPRTKRSLSPIAVSGRCPSVW